jgi:hypothetical protein
MTVLLPAKRALAGLDLAATPETGEIMLPLAA